MKAIVRKYQIIVEETCREAGKDIHPSTRKAAAIAVIENPFKDGFSDDLEELMQIGAEMGDILGRKAVDALGISPTEAQSYGKAAIVGEAGELEHLSLIHI